MKTLDALSSDVTDWLHQSAFPLWWSRGADHRIGGFNEAINFNGEPTVADRRARVQARQIYAFAMADRLGWSGPWNDAVVHGLDFFLDRYTRTDHLFRTLVAADGVCVNDDAWLYDQAFALFALAEAARVLPSRAVDLARRAHTLRLSLQAWRLPEGGFAEPPAAYRRQSNPHMHLLEACLAWETVNADPAWALLADEIAVLALSRFIDANGALHEFFVEGWKPAPGVDGRIVEPGHQFEWAWLLERWARLRGHEGAHKAAERLYRLGVEWGVRDDRGVATQQVLDDGSIHDDVARLWPQTERIKAALILGDSAEAARGIAGLMLYLDTPIAGLWRDKLRPDGSFVDEPAPASSFYHIVCAIAELRANGL